MAYAIPIITDAQTGYEFKDRNLEFLNQPITFIPFVVKIRKLLKAFRSGPTDNMI